MPIMSLVSHLKDIKQQNKQIIKLIQCNDYLAGDIDCIKNKIACELSPTINLRFILQLVDLTLCLLCNFSCFLSAERFPNSYHLYNFFRNTPGCHWNVKHFGSRSGLTWCPALSWSKLFANLNCEWADDYSELNRVKVGLAFRLDNTFYKTETFKRIIISF